MKANEAPEKLYLISDEDIVKLSYDPSTKLQYGNRYDFVDKEVFPIEKGSDIEYTRTDAFIEKACEYLQINLWRVVNEEPDFRQRFVTDFRNYLKGE